MKPLQTPKYYSFSESSLPQKQYLLAEYRRISTTLRENLHFITILRVFYRKTWKSQEVVTYPPFFSMDSSFLSKNDAEKLHSSEKKYDLFWGWRFKETRVWERGERGGERVCNSERARRRFSYFQPSSPKKVIFFLFWKYFNSCIFWRRIRIRWEKWGVEVDFFWYSCKNTKKVEKIEFLNWNRKIRMRPANKYCSWAQGGSEKLLHDHLLNTLKTSVENATRPQRGHMQILWTNNRLRGNPYP